MDYPKILLPQSRYKKITTGLSESYLLRITPSKDIMHPSTKQVREELLADKDDRFFNYSLNLMGHYEIDHIYIKIEGEKEIYYHNRWDEKSDVECPLYEKDFIINTKNGYFLLNIGKIHNTLKIPFNREIPEKQEEAIAIVCHVPTNCNFWHFEIMWKDPKTNTPIKPDTKPKWRKLLAAAIKSAIREHLDVNIKEFKTVEEVLYIQ